MTKIVEHVTKATTADPFWLIVQTETPIQADDLRGNRRLWSKYKLAAWSINVFSLTHNLLRKLSLSLMWIENFLLINQNRIQLVFVLCIA